MFNPSFQRKLAREAYNSAKDAITNRVIAEGKTDRLEHAISQMQNALAIYSRLSDDMMAKKCQGFIHRWQAEKLWLSANRIPTIDRISVRENAVDSLNKAIQCFESVNDRFQTMNINVRKSYYLGIIDSQKLDLKQARQHFEEALKISKEVDRDSIDFYQAAIVNCEAWELVVRRFKQLEHITYDEIIRKFQEALDLYRLTKDVNSINYMEGWRDFFRYILEPTKDELFESFKTKVLTIEVEVDGKIPRVWLKTGVLNNLSDHIAIFQKELRAFLLERQFNIFAEELNGWLIEILHSRKPPLMQKRESLEGCCRFLEKYMRVRPGPAIEWLIWTWRSTSKHKYQSKEDAERVSRLAVESANMIDILPPKIKEFKDMVSKKSVEIRNKRPVYPLDQNRFNDKLMR